MRWFQSVGLVIVAVMLMQGCFLYDDKIDPPEKEININFTEDHAGPTFASFKINTDNFEKELNFTLFRNDSTLLWGKYTGGDTLLCDWELKADSVYNYYIVFDDDDELYMQSKTITIQTMGTTSHEFTWETVKICENGGYIQAVEAVTADNVWAVGDFSCPDDDSSGYSSSNAAHYNGDSWILKSIHSSAPLYEIHYFDENDIWVTSGRPKLWNGNLWYMYHFADMGVVAEGEDYAVEGLWGSSSDNMYFISTQGYMVHKQGDTFTKLPVPKYKYYRIDGIEEPGDSGQRVWVGATRNYDGTNQGAVLYNDGLQWQILWNADLPMYNPIYEDVGAIYTDPVDKFVLFSVGGSVDNILALHNQKYPQQF
ncbi:MAG: hypothetical protein KAI81_05455, partial [Candidatus Marinimicrobia bacterium]|nr:hypothetical protein [Candidatus Neomarinimicrobiota bacterium]